MTGCGQGARYCLALWLAALGGLGCGDDSTEEAPLSCPTSDADLTGCTIRLAPSGGDDTKEVQTALIEATSGSHICFCPGTYQFTKELSLSVTNATLRGVGSSRDDVVLDFAGQTAGDDGVTVTSDGFTIEHMWIKNTPGNGIVVTGAEDVTFSDLKVSWDAGSVTENGAYAVYPVQCERVIVEDCEVIGASDAGIYVGQCQNAIVRNNTVHGNVAGIEIENTVDADVYGNEAYDNTAGVLAFVLPNLEQKEGTRAKIHNNNTHDNNRANFGEPGSIVGAVPAGIGVLLLAADDTEVHDNTITGNESTGILAVSFQTLAALLSDVKLDPETDPYMEKLFVHGNTMSGNGASPKSALALLNVTPLEDVVWDGVENPDGAGGGICLGDKPPAFRNFGGFPGIGDPSLHSTDTTEHECTPSSLPSLSW